MKSDGRNKYSVRQLSENHDASVDAMGDLDMDGAEAFYLTNPDGTRDTSDLDFKPSGKIKHKPTDS